MLRVRPPAVFKPVQSSKSWRGGIAKPACLVEQLEIRRFLSVEFVADINSDGASSNPSAVVECDGVLYFSAQDPTHGRELFKSDGTVDGISLVVDLNPDGDTAIGDLAAFNGAVYFGGGPVYAANRGTWRSDGTASGTQLFLPGVTANQFQQIGNDLYFIGEPDAAHPSGTLYKTDGTTQGTIKLSDTGPRRYGMRAVNGKLLYFDNSNRLWTSDGTPGGTQLVKTPVRLTNYFHYSLSVGADGYLYFNGFSPAVGNELFKTDGTPQGTTLVKDIVPGAGSSNADQLISANGAVFFHATDQAGSTDLWRSDGTDAGTYRVKQSAPRPSLSFSADPVSFQNAIYFAAQDESGIRSLWRSDGTDAGTRPIGGTGTRGDHNVLPVAATSTTLFFQFNDGVHGSELWASDGTDAGTFLLKDIAPGSRGTIILTPSVIGDTFYFSAEGVDGRELWRSDGTAEGTVQVTNIRPGTADSDSAGFTETGGKLFFAGYDPAAQARLFVTDNVPDRIAPVIGIVPTADPITARPTDLTGANGVLFFNVGDELWTSNGTNAGTRPIRPGGASIHAMNLTGGYGRLFFTVAGTALWTSDGTDAGTYAVESQQANAPEGYLETPLYPAPFSTGMLMTAQVDRFTRGVFFTDGTAAGTVQLASTDVNGGFATVGNLAYFVAKGTQGLELWQTDGTPQGTHTFSDFPDNLQVDRLFQVNGQIYFLVESSAAGTRASELWKNDRTPAGVSRVYRWEGIGAGAFRSFAGVGGRLFFLKAAPSSQWDGELWSTDGTELGTTLLHAFKGVVNSYRISELAANGNLVFLGGDGGDGRGTELWSSDGTVAGTLLYQDIFPGPGSSNPKGLRNVQGALWFASTDGQHGSEPWRFAPAVQSGDFARPSISASSWSRLFLNELGRVTNASLTLGYELFGPTKEVPWAGIDTFKVLNRDVRADDFSLTSDAGESYVPVSFEVNAAAGEAIWRIAAPLPAGRYTLNCGSSGPRYFEILPGDVNRDRRVNATDLVQTRNRIGRSSTNPGTGASEYTIFSDVDGNAVINAADLVRVRNHVGQVLPTPPALLRLANFPFATRKRVDFAPPLPD